MKALHAKRSLEQIGFRADISFIRSVRRGFGGGLRGVKGSFPNIYHQTKNHHGTLEGSVLRSLQGCFLIPGG